jgi:hypothetical protein
MFSDCTRLKEFHVPASAYIDSINRAIPGCTGLETITVDPNNPDFEGNGYNCVIRKQMYLGNNYVKALIWGCKNTVIPSDVHYIYGIEGGAFSSTPEQITSSFIPNHIVYMNHVFYNALCTSINLSFTNLTYCDTFAANCKNLKSIIFNVGSATVSSFARFVQNSPILENVTITGNLENPSVNIVYNSGYQADTITLDLPDSIVSLNNGTFSISKRDSGILICRAITPPTCNSGFITSIIYIKAIYVPETSVEAYKAASVWSNYASKIEAISNE